MKRGDRDGQCHRERRAVQQRLACLQRILKLPFVPLKSERRTHRLFEALEPGPYSNETLDYCIPDMLAQGTTSAAPRTCASGSGG